jgi:hypothetical protein
MLRVRRVMGSETEFGLSQPGNPRANPMRDSARVVDAYAGPRGLKSSQSFWDFATESPLADARGFIMNLADADSSQLTHIPQDDVEAQYLANVVTENGARYYVDHAHPEYSSPEVLTPRDIVTFDRAGDLVGLASVRALEKTAEPVNLYKNNTDSKGSSYGTHENYLVDRGDRLRRHRRRPRPVLRHPADPLRLRSSRDRPRGRRQGLPDLLARGLLRSRGRPRDDTAPSDRQHPRRTARRRREVPTAARDHRGCDPGGACDLRPLRLDLARARTHRSRPRPTHRTRRPAAVAVGCQPRSQPQRPTALWPTAPR